MSIKFIHDYIAAGFKVFPLNQIVNGGCECGNPECPTVGKHPKLSNWNGGIVWSDDQIDYLLEYGLTGFGVLMSGVYLVVDIDPRNGGDESYRAICDDLGYDIKDKSSFVVATGGGGYHVYFKLNETTEKLCGKLDKYKGIDFKSSGFVVGCGSLHVSGLEYEVVKGGPCSVEAPPSDLLELLIQEVERDSGTSNSSIDYQEIPKILSYIKVDDLHYEEWIASGMAIHQATQGDGEGFGYWDAWSAKGAKYNQREMDHKWRSFGKKGGRVVAIGTLISMASMNGYVYPVTFTNTYKELEPGVSEDVGGGLGDVAGDGSGLGGMGDLSGIDLLKPPGFVGEVTEWINGQCRYPRETLAVGAALSTVSNCLALRYTDSVNAATANLFVFSVAGSSTGKEAVMQAQTSLHMEFGGHIATHGAIKSEQEIIRNLIRHQAAFYIIDELGIHLKKIVNAQASGGAAYLEGVIGTLMSAYSKANGTMLVTGDMKEEVKEKFLVEMSKCAKKVDNNEDSGGKYKKRIDTIAVSLREIENGIKNPVLSIIGFTTPITFESLVTFEQAANGFIGRALFVNEAETNPRAIKRFKQPKMSNYISTRLKALYGGGEASDDGIDRVEFQGERIVIPVTDSAADYMDKIYDTWFDYAEDHKSYTGMESVVRRGYELMAKVSLTLGAPSGTIELEHVKWAYKLIQRDLDDKIRLAHANTIEEASPVDALSLKVMGIISQEHGETLRVLKQRLDRNGKKGLAQVLEKLMEMKEVVKITTTGKRSKQEVHKYYRASKS